MLLDSGRLQFCVKIACGGEKELPDRAMWVIGRLRGSVTQLKSR
jgi:hypothetical protein